MAESLIVTVGSSPLPVVVSVLYLEPTRVFLVYTPDVSRVVRRVCDHLGRKLPGCERNLVEIPDHRSAARIHARLEGLKASCPSSGLNYTGGTKLMAVHTHRFWTDHGGKPRDASYLGGDGRLYFDDQTRDPVAGKDLPALSLAELRDLHFGDKLHKQADEHLDTKRLNLATRIWHIVCQDGFAAYREHLPPLYGENGDINIKGYDLTCSVKADWNAARKQNFEERSVFSKKDLSGLFKMLGVEATDIDGFGRWMDGEAYEGKAKTRLEYAQWLWSGWLEVWLADRLAKAQNEDSTALFDEVHQSVRVGKEPDDFEMDVVAVHGYRTFLFSCTVDHKNYLVKSKHFEAAQRTDRIGGEHARAAVVCLHKKPHEVLRTVQEEHWPGYDTLRLFGEKHVKGDKAQCQIPTGDEAPRDVTLLEGIREWATT